MITVRYETGETPSPVRVELTSSGGAFNYDATSDAEGKVIARVPSDSDYTLAVSGDGIEPVTQHLELSTTSALNSAVVTVRRPPAQPVASGGIVSVTELNIPGRARDEYRKGEKRAKAKAWREAIDHFLKAIAIDPRYAAAYRAVALARLELGDVQGARQALEQALALDNKYIEAHLDLGRLLFAQGDKSGAEKNFQAALATDPMNLAALTLFAATELALGKDDEAIKATQRVHRLASPNRREHALAHIIAGSALRRQHKDSDARAEYNLYLAEAPDGQFATEARTAITEGQGR